LLNWLAEHRGTGSLAPPSLLVAAWQSAFVFGSSAQNTGAAVASKIPEIIATFQAL
jgi:hypothetical protein